MFSYVCHLNLKLDDRPNISPKPTPRALQSSLGKPKQSYQNGSTINSNHTVSSSNGSMMETNGCNNGACNNDEDETDEGLAALKRQPSIRDRKKV